MKEAGKRCLSCGFCCLDFGDISEKDFSGGFGCLDFGDISEKDFSGGFGCLDLGILWMDEHLHHERFPMCLPQEAGVQIPNHQSKQPIQGRLIVWILGISLKKTGPAQGNPKG